MGQMKREQERLDSLYLLGQDALRESGAAQECPHGTLLSNDDSEADKRAYGIATNWVKAGKVDGTRQEMMDAVQSAMADTQGECPTCAKHRDE